MKKEAELVAVERNWPQFVARKDFEELAPLAQELFLKDAMHRLSMTKEELAQRISVTRKCLGVASRTIIWPLVKQIGPLLIPLLHGLHRRLAAQR